MNFRKEIAYWFFLILGITGATIFTYDYYSTDDYTFWEWVGISSAFAVFIFRPTILIDFFEMIKNKLK